jgi:hypothetical protein
MPTLRQKLVASKMVGNGGNMGKAMLEAGYSKAMAKNPYKLIHSKGWLEVTESLISDEKLLKIHRELLNSTKANMFTFSAGVSDKEIYSIIESGSKSRVVSIRQVNDIKICLFTIPDHQIQLRAVELGYKIRGRLNNTRGHHIDEDNSEEVESIMARFRRIFPDSKL